eukprot:CAMPEP_0174349154 /NCGR_PEP_ID=MMETSP0811_2-20130205/5817_1 /TAXON_ID=73025 ORGANISM="Eutreptiella gymnastica-like, Strain CCMP1594" /NCGR_SAMPLE_ID=MMETSP0811_2 /ASSEMBLY_ACC=CAM_ASM_000667 /LENGTH=55 /DNA_ID=CAMNT_0015476309 /DNA_START=416 /DNA_END=580 /DNA_ORIENTATION=-
MTYGHPTCVESPTSNFIIVVYKPGTKATTTTTTTTGTKASVPIPVAPVEHVQLFK